MGTIQDSRRVGIFRIQGFKPSETFIVNQARHLRRWRSLYLSYRRFGPPPADIETVDLGDDRIDLVRSGALNDPAPMRRRIGERTPDLIHAHFAVDAVYALPLARALRRPLVVTLHGFDVTTRDSAFLKSGKLPLIRAVLGRRALQRSAERFVAVSDYIRKRAVEAGYPEARMVSLPVGVEIPSADSVRTGANPTRVLHIGRLVEKKGTAQLIEAMARAPRALGLKLVIAGDGPLRPILEQKVAALGLGESVEFRGFMPHAETLELLAGSAALAVPSVTARSGDMEGLPTVVMEAAARGVPVVGYGSSGIAEAVLHDETGLLSPEGDIDGLARHLAAIVSEPELARKLGAGARKLAEQRYDIARQTAALETLYDEVYADFMNREN